MMVSQIFLVRGFPQVRGQAASKYVVSSKYADFFNAYYQGFWCSSLYSCHYMVIWIPTYMDIFILN